MAKTQQWKILQLECYPTENGDVDVVFTAHWSLSAEEVVGDKTYTGYVYGAQGITHDADSTFIPFAELTEEVVLDWVKAAMGDETVLAYETNVVQQIEDQKNPKVISPALPW